MINNSLFLEGRKIPDLNPYSLEYKEWWSIQTTRCKQGYTVGGVFMPPTLYFYVNFGTIELLDEESGRKKRGRPELRDVEWEVFTNHWKAKKEGKGFMMISGRRGGKSFCSANIAVWEFTFFPDNEIVIGSSDNKYTHDLMSKIGLSLEGLAGTEFYHNKIKNIAGEEIRSGYEYKKEGKKVKGGFNSRILGISFKNNFQAAVGKSASHFAFEEVGKFENLLDSYAASEPCWKEGTRWFGTPFLAGTGGDMEKGTVDAQKMFYDPETYNLLSFDAGDWKESSKGKKIAFFLPGWKVLNDYKVEGNTDKNAAITALMRERERKRQGNHIAEYLREIMYYPITPEEAFIQSSGNMFPRDLLQMQVDNILTTPKYENIGVKGRLVWKRNDGGGIEEESIESSGLFSHGNIRERIKDLDIKSSNFDYRKYIDFIPDRDLTEAEYPFNPKANNEGSIVIYEFPEEYNNDIPYGLYVAGTDPYAMDEVVESTSLGATYIYKRFISANRTSDWIVAEYVGRARTVDEYAENVRKLLYFYNARCLYENNVRGLKEYFERKNCVYLLLEQPQVLSDILSTSEVKRSHGIHMSPKVKQFMLNKIRDYLLTEYDKGKFKVDHIFSINLLRELLAYNEEDNFDRVIAFGLVLLFDTELLEYSPEIKDNENSITNQVREWGNRIFVSRGDKYR